MELEKTIPTLVTILIAAGVLAVLAVMAWREGERRLAGLYGAAGSAAVVLLAYFVFFSPLTR